MDEILKSILCFVNDQIDFHGGRASEFSGSRRALKHQETHDNLVILKNYLIEKDQSEKQKTSGLSGQGSVSV